MLRISGLGLAVLFLATQSALAQTATSPPPTSDPRAIAFAAQAMAVLTGGVAISDVTLTGTATRTAGSDIDTGSITLEAKGIAESRFEFSGSAGTLSEVRNASDQEPQGTWTGPDGVLHSMAQHNCLIDAAWFFPALSVLSQASTANVIATYVGQEVRGGASVQHLRFASTLPNLAPTSASLLASLTNEDIYLDSTSLLPVAVNFNAHPDNDALTNIAVEIDFSNYQTVSGIRVPFKIQKLLNNGPFLEINIESVTVNSGLSDSTFAIQ